jgi:hypothetical protein
MSILLMPRCAYYYVLKKAVSPGSQYRQKHFVSAIHQWLHYIPPIPDFTTALVRTGQITKKLLEKWAEKSPFPVGPDLFVRL